MGHTSPYLWLRNLLQIFISATFLFASFINANAQNPLLGIGNKVCDMDDATANITTQTLPTPPICCSYNSSYFYSGSVSTRNQTVQFDQYGQLLFFIVDGVIYDRDGYLIAKAGNCVEDECAPCLWKESHQVIVTPYPGMCDRFIIIRDYGSQIIFSFLDFSLPNCHFPDDRQGALISTDEINDGDYPELDFYSLNFENVEFIDGYSFIFDPFDDVKPGTLHMDLIEKPNNVSKILVAVHQGEYAIMQINPTNIDVLSTYQFTTGTYERFEEGECEIGYDSVTNEYLVAFTSAEAGYNEIDIPDDGYVNIVVLRMSAGGVVTDIHGYQPAFVMNQPISNGVAGLEFSPNGQYLYFSQHREPKVGYISLSDAVTHAMPFTISNISNYDNTRLEGNKTENGSDNAIYFLGDDNTLAAISGANSPATSVWVSNVNTSLPIGTVPSYYAYSSEQSNFKSLQTQTFNAPEIVSFLSSQGCCLAQTNAIGIQGMTVNTVNDGNWTYGVNPFGNATNAVRIVDDITFQTGTNTIITNMVLEFDVDADFIIEKGAKVSLIGSTLTSISCDNIMWPGVDLFGTTDASSTIDQYPTINPDQGYLYLNNSIIENAMIGVDVGTTTDFKGGGIIKAYNSKFRNNQYDVIFRKYHYIDQNGNYVQNKSLFNNCTFITDAHLNNPGLSPATHVSLYDVEKIDFLNCSFMNTTALTTYNWVTRGTGIFASQASFKVDGLNDIWNGQSSDPDQTTFYKLRYGIRSFGNNVPLAFYTCKQQEFQQCLYGIINYNTDNVQIYQNNFQLPEVVLPGFESTMERGIYLTNSTGYTVEQNFFDGYNDPAVSDSYPSALGIWVENSGDFDNKIRNNDFDEMKLGTYVTKNNRYYVFGVDEPGDADDDGSIDQTGLQLFCNTYTNGQTDIFRDSETLMRQDQGGNQPNGFLNAGNRFSANNCNGAISDFVIDPYNNFYNNYWCHDQANTIPDCGGISNYPGTVLMDLLTVSVDANNAYDNADCPNTYGGPIITGPNPGVISGLIGELQTVRAELQDAKDTYLQVVDGSQKQSTLDILSEAFPHESGFYRNLLMQRYPLSDEVLKRLIIEASRLSSWHLTEVFLANSPLSKEILYKIEEANILTSFFISFLYDADSGASLRRLMELNMLSLATERDQLIQSIARAGLAYETDAESETDQPVYLNDYLAQFAMQDGSTALRIRAANLAATGDYPSAIALLANEPLLVSYSNILQMEQSVSRDWNLLNTSQISTLWDIYNSKKDYSSSLALSILQQIGVADFEPEPRVPIQHRSLLIAKDDKREELPLLGVWPNPATSSAWLHYPIEADEKATIQVFDPQGRLVQSFQPNTKGLVELSLKNYESGIYVVQLIAFDKVVENIKLTVIHQN